MKRTYKS